MHSGRVLDDALLLGVAVEAGDRAQPPRDRRSRLAAGFHVAGEGFDMRPADIEQAHPDIGDPRRVLA
jgi:hypothetical protein